MARIAKGLPPGTVVDGRVICGASRSNGEPCKQWPVRGEKRCRLHGGILDPVVIKKRELVAKINGQMVVRGWEPVLDPLAAIADLAGEVLEFKELCRAQLNELQEWVGYSEEDVEYARALVQTYERSLDRSNKILADMTRLGLDAAALGAAQARPSIEQARSLGNVLDRVFAELNLTQVQKERVPVALRMALEAEGLL